jgi:23S rRNA (uridine2552-2'-O)-methyltransferase
MIKNSFSINIKGIYSNIAFKSNNSSNIWLARQKRDPYVKRAIKELYRARSAFKLIEINEKFKFIKSGDIVLDIGASPGSWSQVAVNLTNSNQNGILISLHILCLIYFSRVLL